MFRGDRASAATFSRHMELLWRNPAVDFVLSGRGQAFACARCRHLSPASPDPNLTSPRDSIVVSPKAEEPSMTAVLRAQTPPSAAEIIHELTTAQRRPDATLMAAVA